MPGQPEIHINNVNAYHSRLKEWLRVSMVWQHKTSPTYLGWRRTLEAGTQAPDPHTWLLAASGKDITNTQRDKSVMLGLFRFRG